MQIQEYTVGFDIGGSFTDCVILDVQSNIVAFTKERTNHTCLEQTVCMALQNACSQKKINAKEIKKIGITTTWATNAMIEGQGCKVGLILIGYQPRKDIKAVFVEVVPGGHSITGAEETPLALERLISIIQHHKGTVDAYAVCSLMSFENPAHELVAEQAIQMIDPKPVFCAHKASSQAGMYERANTAILNAQLLPRMQVFVQGVTAGLQQAGCFAPFCIIDGKGSLLDAETVLKHATAIIAGGPFTSAFFAGQCLQQAEEKIPEYALAIDMGGTTTDICLLHNGLPVFSEQGLTLGRWDIHVDAAEMFTLGLGGDSIVYIEEKNEEITITIGPERGVPCLFAEQSAEYLTPTDIVALFDKTIFPETRKQVQAHSKAMASVYKVDEQKLLRQLKQQIEEALASALLVHVAKKEAGGHCAEYLQYRTKARLLTLQASLNVPLVGVGGAIAFFLPHVAQSLQTTYVIQPYAEVGGAVAVATLVLQADFNVCADSE